MKLTFPRGFPRAIFVTVLIFSLLLTVGFTSLGGREFEHRPSIDPFLNYLLEKDRSLREETGEGLDPSSFRGSLALYKNDRPLPKAVPYGEGEVVVEGARKAFGIGVIFKAKDHVRPFSRSGVTVHSVFGDIATAHATLAGIRGLIRDSRIEYVARSKMLRPKLTKSVPAIEADVLHSEQPIDKGEGVLVGIVDTGIDYDNKDFRVEEKSDGTEEESSRIRFIWDQTSDFGSSPFHYGYGTEYTKSQIEDDIKAGYGPSQGAVRERDSAGHGTHVAGIAVGDGSSSNAGYVGVAPKASLICVDSTFTTSDVIDGVEYVKDKADQLGLSAVVNLSLGTQAGPHDGSSLFEQAIDSLSGGDFLISVAAGNSGNVPIHRRMSLLSGSTEKAVFRVPSFTPSSDFADYVELNGYYGSSGNIDVKVLGPDGVETGWVGRGESAEFKTGKGNLLISNGPTEVNEDNEVYIKIGDIGKDTPPAEGEWEVKFRGVEDTLLDIWVTQVLLGEKLLDVGFENGNSNYTIAEPGNAESVLTVGSFNSRNSWNGHMVSGYPVGKLSAYSSRGPTRDGREKPDLAAPGAWVVSTLSGSYSPPEFYMASDGKHYASAGTSMAAPHVSGSAALLWHAAPELTRSEVADTFRSTTYSVSAGDASNTWGSGKLNIKKGVYSTGVPEVQMEEGLWIKAAPNPASEEVNFYYDVPEGMSGPKIRVFNIIGKEMFSSDQLTEGQMKYTWNLKDDQSGTKLANGLYLYTLTVDGQRSGLHRLVIRR